MELAFVPTIVILLAILIVFICSRLYKRYPKTIQMVLKVLSIIYAIIVLVGHLLPDGFVYVINGSFYGQIYYDRTDVWQTVLRWGLNISSIVLPMAVFFKNRLMKNVAIYLCLPFTILSVLFLNDFVYYFVQEESRAILDFPYLSESIRTLILDWGFRSFYFGAQLLIGLVIPATIFFGEKHRFNWQDKTEKQYFFISLPFIIIASMPTYALQSLFGFASGRNNFSYSFAQLVWTSLIVVEIIAIYNIFKNKDYQTRYELCVFLCIQLFMHYNSTYIMGFTFKKLPFQLCNLAAYFFLIAIVFKRKRLFNFAYIANLVGAAIAVAAPDVEDGIFSFWYVHFVMEHMQVFAIPVIIGLLKIFPRFKKKDLKDVFVGFSIYFFFCLISGTLLNGLALKTGDTGFKVNYFYLFDLAKIHEYFPLIGLFSKRVVLFDYYTIYPIFQFGVYVLYFALCVICYYVIEKLYDVANDHKELRQVRLSLREKRLEKKKIKQELLENEG